MNVGPSYGDAELRKIIAVRMSPVRIFAPGLLFPEVSLGQCTSRCGLCCGDETTVYSRAQVKHINKHTLDSIVCALGYFSPRSLRVSERLTVGHCRMPPHQAACRSRIVIRYIFGGRRPLNIDTELLVNPDSNPMSRRCILGACHHDGWGGERSRSEMVDHDGQSSGLN